MEAHSLKPLLRFLEQDLAIPGNRLGDGTALVPDLTGFTADDSVAVWLD